MTHRQVPSALTAVFSRRKLKAELLTKGILTGSQTLQKSCFKRSNYVGPTKWMDLCALADWMWSPFSAILLDGVLHTELLQQPNHPVRAWPVQIVQNELLWAPCRRYKCSCHTCNSFKDTLPRAILQLTQCWAAFNSDTDRILHLICKSSRCSWPQHYH